MILFSILYVLSTGPQGEMVVTYDGMNEAAISRAEISCGRTPTFITQKEYQNWLDAHPYIPPASNVDRAIADFKDKGKTVDVRLDALIKILGI